MEYTRALLERALEGGYQFADCLIAPDGCSMLNRCVENMELLKAMGEGKPDFFFENMEIPMKCNENGLNLYVLQCKNHILKPLSEHYGIDTGDAAIRQAVAEHNEICRHYMEASQCPRYMNQDKIQERKQYAAELAKEYHADGIIYEQMKFCDPWAYERMMGTAALREKWGYPVLSLDRAYASGSSGQTRTRIQAFVESVEIKKIQ